MSGIHNSTLSTQTNTFSKRELNEKQCAIFALKNLGFDGKEDGSKQFASVVTCEFLYKVLDSPPLSNLREQVLLMIKQKFSRPMVGPTVN